MAKPAVASLLSLSLCFLLLCHSSMAQFGFGQEQERSPWESQRRFGAEGRCRLESLNALQPTRRVESEAGFTEYFDENNDEMQCAGVAVHRRTINPRGLLLPSYSNVPRLVYIVQGSGITGAVIPGCPETYQSLEQGGEQQMRQRSRDQHQKIKHFREGDIIAMPAGVAHWCYNDGETPVVAINVLDMASAANQLDRNRRKFSLAGSQQQQPMEREQSSGDNIFAGFDLDMLADALGVNREVAKKLQSQEGRRKGEMVRVERGLHLVMPPPMMEEEREGTNGMEQAMCNMKCMSNIGQASRADIYSWQWGWITNLNSQKLPILKFLRMSAEKGVLHRDAMLAPHWNMNAHCVMYVTRGRARVQVVGDGGRRVFDGEVQQGQLVVVPQQFVVVKQARGEEGFEWVAVKTNDNAMASQIVGRGSVMRGMPAGVIMNSYPGMSMEEARMVKSNRGQHAAIFPPTMSQQGGRADA